MDSFFYKRLSFYCFNLSPYPCLTSYLYQYNVFFYLDRDAADRLAEHLLLFFNITLQVGIDKCLLLPLHGHNLTRL